MSDTGHTESLPADKIGRALLLFAALTVLLAGGAYAIILKFGLVRYYVALLMWTPGLAALLTCRLMGVGAAILGWHWGKARWHAAAYLTPLLYGLIAYGLIWGLGLGGLVNGAFVAESGKYLGLTGWSETGAVIFAVIMLSTVGMIWHLATALGEEIGWRGLLTPLLMRRFPFPVASLIAGLAWSAWHVPLIYYTTYNAGPFHLHLQMLAFTVMTVGLSFIMTYLRLKAGTLWVATTFHAAHNVFVLSILHPMTVQYDQTWRYANEFGLVLPCVVVPFALYAWYRAHKEGLARPQAEGSMP